MQRRSGRFTGGHRFQKQRDFGGSGAPLCRKCNNKHFRECKRGSGGCYTCGQMGHRAAQCPQHQQRPHQPPFLPPAPPSKLQDIVVILRLVVEVPLTIRAMPLLILQGSISTLRTLSIREVLCCINHIQPVGLNGTKGDSPSRKRLLLAVQDLQGSLVNRDRDVVFMLIEVVVDDNRIRDVFITCHCKMLRTILI
ncbi:hypothetical protein ACFX2F_034606 [Malus domestica]